MIPCAGRPLGWLLALALLLAPALGQVHRVLHGAPGHQHAAGERHDSAHPGEAAHQAARQAGLEDGPADKPAHEHEHEHEHEDEHAQAHADADQAQPGAQASWLAPLLGEHGDESGCRLYDQLGGADALTAAAVALPPPVWAVHRLRRSAAGWQAPACTPFSARAPPAIR